MPGSRRRTVAVVDDEVRLRQLYSAVLADEYEVREAASGETALNEIDEDVDAMLLDRELNGLSGEAVIEQLRDAGSDIPVAMVTAKRPEFDVLDMDVDDYVVKPVGANEIREVVETLLLRREYDETIREYYALASRLSALRFSNELESLESDERFIRAEQQLEEAKRRAVLTLNTAIEAGMFEELVSEPPSTVPTLGEVNDGDSSAFRFN